MTGTRNAVATSLLDRGGSLVALEELFVSIDLDADVAYVAYEEESAIHWDEVSRADGGLLARMGARSLIHLGSSSRLGFSATTSGVAGSQRGTRS
jgi:hypothetical protein